jgi:signal transduction histidine kinase
VIEIISRTMKQRGRQDFTNLHSGLTLCVTLVVLACASVGAAQSPPQQVLLLYSYERDFAPHRDFSALFRPELSRSSREPVDFIEVSLQAARVTRIAPADSKVGRVQLALAGRQPDLVVPIGGPAALFAQNHRHQLFPGAPMLLAGVDHRFVRNSAITANDTAVAVDHEPARLVENILNVLPDTKTIFVVVGASHLEQAWLREMKHTFRRFEDRVTFFFANELSFAEMLTRSAALPSNSAILFAILSLDAAGVPLVENQALAELCAAANAPVFGVRSTQLGRGIVGGPLLSVEELSHKTADVALRLLSGEPARDVRTPTQVLAAPVFDWRELRRWDIDEERLPQGSAIQFREPTAWQRDKRPIVVFVAVAGIQAMLVVGLAASLTRQRRTARKQRESEGRLELTKALSSLSQRLMQTQEQERALVARELKDDLCQRMTVLTIELHDLGQAPVEGHEAEIRCRAEEVRHQLAELSGEMVAISDQLHNSKLDLLGLAAATRIYCTALASRHGVTIDVHDDGVPPAVAGDVSLVLFRVMQEALHNVTKHAAARRVTVSLRGDAGEIQLEVADDGVGFDPKAVVPDRALGLVGMRERLSLVDGECAIESRPGAGTRLRARVPLRPDIH